MLYILQDPTQVVEYLSNESIPVMAHLGLVPRKSILTGGLRFFGKTPKEAITLLKSFKSMESAGAFAVEAEVIAEKTLKFISQNSKLITINLVQVITQMLIIYLWKIYVVKIEIYQDMHLVLLKFTNYKTKFIMKK